MYAIILSKHFVVFFFDSFLTFLCWQLIIPVHCRPTNWNSTNGSWKLVMSMSILASAAIRANCGSFSL